jgi:pectate lyase
MAKVVTAFMGVPDGEVYPKEFAPGDEVHGDLGAVAVREGWAEEAGSSTGSKGGEGGEQKAAKPAENKSRKAAPENK